MKLQIKGGVWKNSEDEVVKAAVMKYGLNQWDRIASLLARKSAKQVKARWFEWLDPSIRKVEWSRAEEEKLLHLAKLLPTQWRTIGPLIGRTPAQCLEHYEKLLDDAAGAGARERAEVNPETRPARPDAVDMDEDEKEMLSEARARLANTKGKKEKRMVREAQLEEARRLAMLQRTRELKAAGILSAKTTAVRKRGKIIKDGIDHAREIAFERKAPLGFHPVDDEEARLAAKRREDAAQEGFRRRDIKEADGKGPKDVAAAKQKDAERKAKKRKEEDIEGFLADAGKKDRPEVPRKRSKLNLPAPQMSDADLATLARMDREGQLEAAALASESAQRVTGFLVSDYTTPSLATPGLHRLRTPRLGGATPAGISASEAILQEARSMYAMSTAATPLLGGAAPGATLRPDFKTGGKATPSIAAAAAPTPRLSQSLSATPLRLPAGGSVEHEPQHHKGGRRSLVSKLAQLPRPTNAFRIAAPEARPREDGAGDRANAAAAAAFAGSSTVVADAADVEAQAKAREAERRAESLAQRPTPTRRGLPRPLANNPPGSGNPLDGPEIAAAREIIDIEVALALDVDMLRYPEDGADLEAVEGAPSLEPVDPALLARAERLIGDERVALEGAAGEAGRLATVLDALSRELIYCPSRGEYVMLDGSQGAAKAELEGALHEVDTLQVHRASELKRFEKLDKKVSVLLKGYQARNRDLVAEVQAKREALAQALREAAAFGRLRQLEARSGPARVDRLKTEIRHLTELNRDLQQSLQDQGGQ